MSLAAALVGTAAIDAGAGATAAATTGLLGSAGAFSTAGLGTIASVASTAIQGVGSFMSGKANAASANYNASIASMNANIEKQNATWAAQSGEEQVAQQQQKTRANVGAITAAQAANNITINSGVSGDSGLDVRSSASQLGELSALNIRSNAAKQAYGYLTGAWSDTAQANLDKANAGYSAEAGDIGAGADLLGGAGSAANNYANWQLKTQGIT